MDVQQTLRQAFQHHQSGQLAQAESLYQKVLAEQPYNADAMHLLGVAALQSRRFDKAVELIQKAIVISPKSVEYYVNLGAALDGLNRLDESAAAFEKAVQLKPEIAETHANLGKVLRRLGKHHEAVAACRKAVELRPNYLKAHINLGGMLLEMKVWDEAADAFARLIAIRPDLAEAFVGLGTAFKGKRDLGPAIEAFQRAAELQPDQIEIYQTLCALLFLTCQWDLAIECCRKAIAIRPDSIDLLFDLGVAFRKARRPEEARECFQKILAARPHAMNALHNLGNTYRDTGQVAEAIEIWEKVLEENPKSANADSNVVYNLLFDPRQDSESIFRRTRLWGQRHASHDPVPAFQNDRQPQRKLKIGYVSPDFRAHVATLFTVSLLAHHNRQEFEIFCYSNVQNEDKITPRFKALADQWRDISGIDDDAAAAMVRADGIDILVDIAQHMGDNRLFLFARKPAPVQVAWLGYPGTVGLEAIDYRLTDPYLDPPGVGDEFYVEKSIRLPDTFWCYDPAALYGGEIPEISPLPALKNGHVTFGSLNNFCKINDIVLDLWATVLQAIPTSRLLVLVPPSVRRKWFLDRMALHGVASERIAFVPFRSRAEYLNTYARFDLGLDTIPYNGHTTSLDSLYMGVPVITEVGKTVVGRAGWSQLSNLNLTELAARSDDEFVRIAIDWSNDLARLSELRKTLRQRMEESPLMDAKRFAAGMEFAFRAMWEKWCQIQ
jgi:protein O-GlcNAc transferase